MRIYLAGRSFSVKTTMYSLARRGQGETRRVRCRRSDGAGLSGVTDQNYKKIVEEDKAFIDSCEVI